MQSSSMILLSPSFNSHSSGELADTVARVIEEFKAESKSEFDDVFSFTNEQEFNNVDQEQLGVEEEDEETKRYKEDEDEDEDEDDDYEFPCVGDDGQHQSTVEIVEVMTNDRRTR
ncbi:hypothetical protein LOK49_LG09G00975 [Camellia lanceoleosa]|uniref:Uncharacterized protein n=1 Tax=Camellia lanceoleosa TaxID=1840588 RepID=A0ACC0GN69_9ERIC|nr:hypothetical protein LOK49_LG09G00975 [Camellia lanceoleosa]